jgi:hypothetical protein
MVTRSNRDEGDATEQNRVRAGMQGSAGFDDIKGSAASAR